MKPAAPVRSTFICGSYPHHVHRPDGRRHLGQARFVSPTLTKPDQAHLCEHRLVNIGPPTNDTAAGNGDAYARAEIAAQRLAELSGVRNHDVAVVLGTGLADAAESINPISTSFDLRDLPGFPASFVSHQRSEVRLSKVDNRRVLAFLGRLHLYEGYSPIEVAHPIRTAVAAGAEPSSLPMPQDHCAVRWFLVTWC